jgi:hypothetical protein
VVNWTAVSDPGDLAGYNYYRGVDGATPSLIAILGNVVTYTDTTIPSTATSIVAKVASRDTTGNLSAQSTGLTVALTSAAVSTPFELAADTFDRTNNPTGLGTLWDAGYTGLQAFQIVSNVAEPINTTNSLETYNGISAPNNQYVQITLTTVDDTHSNNMGAVLRFANAPTASGYVLHARTGASSGFYTRFLKFTAGSSALLDTETTSPWVAGDIFEARAEGTTLSVYRIRSGVRTLIKAVTDSTYTSGKTGLFAGIANLPADVQLNNFSTGRLDAAAAADTFAHVTSVVTDANGADITFTGSAYKVRYSNDLHSAGSPVEVTGLGGVSTYRLAKVWEPTISFACFEAQGSDGVWETAINPSNYVCATVVPGTVDTTAPATPTGLTVT